MMTKREQTEVFISLFLAWLVYAFCQGDFLAPALALLLVFPSYLKQALGRPSRKSVVNMSWRSLISMAVIFGGTWRNFFEPPDMAVSFIPILIPALQTASIVVAVLAWFRFDYQWRAYYLKFLPWLTVALSVNVPFNALTQVVFWLFCFVSIGFMVAQLYVPVSEASREALKKSRHKSPLIYTYPVFLAVIALALFSALVQSIKLGDDIFMTLIQDYVGRRHLNLFDSTLSLAGSGNTRSDVRPILEIDRGGVHTAYLIGQVFEDYGNGVWKAPVDVPLEPLPTDLPSAGKPVELVMYEYLADVIPVPRGTVAMRSKGASYKKDLNGIVYNVDKKIPKAKIQVSGPFPEGFLKDADRQRLTAVPDFMRQHLKPRDDAIVGKETDPFRMAKKIERFFKQNFQYNLYVDFIGDDRGLLYMLDYRKPAYCSYFAAAMTLMLRERGIPARMVAGFMVTEVSRLSEEKYVVRGRDAHAWVEALLPVPVQSSPETALAASPKTEAPVLRWVRFDPTPPDYRLAAIQADSRLNKIADWIWCSQKRFKAFILDIETKTLVAILFAIVIAIALEEVLKKVFARYFKKGHAGRERGAESLIKNVNPYKAVYQRFELFLKNKLDVDRLETETDAELVQRLRALPGIPARFIGDIEHFLKEYHDARFGGKNAFGLENIIKLLGED
ncbi:MAG: transglutaminase-like domain-containing protein [Candidatus Omnitrophota bacterium]|jgi:transglutaminase-like putative cysteine protease